VFGPADGAAPCTTSTATPAGACSSSCRAAGHAAQPGLVLPARHPPATTTSAARRGAARKRWLLLSLLVLALSLVLLAAQRNAHGRRAAAESADDETHVERDELDGLAARRRRGVSDPSISLVRPPQGVRGVTEAAPGACPSGLSTPRDAARAALAQCEERRRRRTPRRAGCSTSTTTGWPPTE
jgi:hypothetical protein